MWAILEAFAFAAIAKQHAGVASDSRRIRLNENAELGLRISCVSHS
jgi:hypothetical protein